jgi:hypothetical protein
MRTKRYVFDPKSVPFARKAGVELTWSAPKLPEAARRNMDEDEMNERFVDILQCYHAKRGENVYKTVYCDPGCVEIPSPILYSWKELEKFWNFWEPICEGHGLLRAPEHSTGGGGHIHISATEWEQIKIGRDIASRPYLSWVFLHPSDDINATTIANWMDVRWDNERYQMPQWMEPGLTQKGWKERAGRNYGQYNQCYKEQYHGHKESVVSMSNDQGIEFRAFSGAVDLHEQLLHMAFVQRYVDYCSNQPTADVPWKNKFEAAQFLASWKNYDKCELAFMDLILDLGLDPKAYHEFATCYLKSRFHKGMGRFI